MKKNLSLPSTRVLSLGLFAGCGSNSSKTTTVTADSTATTTDDSSSSLVATSTDAPAAGNAANAVDNYCKQADDLAKKLKAVMANPANADATAVMESAAKLTASSVDLIQSQPSDASKITACSQKLTDAVKPTA